MEGAHSRNPPLPQRCGGGGGVGIINFCSLFLVLFMWFLLITRLTSRQYLSRWKNAFVSTGAEREKGGGSERERESSSRKDREGEREMRPLDLIMQSVVIHHTGVPYCF